MTTHLAALQAKADQATATREAAEMELLACMRAIEPTFDGTVAGMQDRHWESKLEGLRPFWELARAHSAYRRAEIAERKARSAAHRAKFAAVPAPPPAPAPPRRKRAKRQTTFADQVRAIWADEAEARAARMWNWPSSR